MTRRMLTVLAAVAMLDAPAAIAQAPTPWQPALDLYAAASYEDALQALDALDREALDDDGVVAVEQHRMLCLMALGRREAAEQAVEALLTVRPAFVLGAADASPRVRAMFDATRRRVLPAQARRQYAEAKRAYDAGDHQRAHDGFATLADVLADSGLIAADASLDDLRTLTEGFRQLSAAALERGRPRGSLFDAGRIVPAPPEAAPTLAARLDAAPFVTPIALAAAVPHEPPPDAVEPLTSEPVPPDAPAESAAPAPRPFTPLDIFTYDWRDKDVVPPTPVAQPISGWWGSMGEPPPGTRLGVVDLVVDEHGRVADAFIYQSVNRVYDAVLLASVKQWQYQPATRGGRAVKYRRVTGVVSGR